MDGRRNILLLIVGLLLCCPRAQVDLAIPTAGQIPIMLKVLTYDRTLMEGAQETIRIGVLYSPDSEASANLCHEADAAFKANAGKTINRLPFSHVLLPLSSAAALEVSIAHQGFDVFCIADEDAKALPDIVSLSQRHGILTMSLADRHVVDGVAMAIEIADGKPQIVINLEAARAAGHDFRANLLRLCRVIK